MRILLPLLVAFAAVLPAHATKPKPAPKPTKNVYWLKLRAKDKFERTKLAQLGFPMEVIVEDTIYTYGDQKALETAQKSGHLVQYLAMETPLDFPGNDSNFHNYAELTQALQELQAQFPQPGR